MLRFFAQRPLPSIMTAMCAGSRPGSTACAKAQSGSLGDRISKSACMRVTNEFNISAANSVAETQVHADHRLAKGSHACRRQAEKAAEGQLIRQAVLAGRIDVQ